MKLSAKDKGRVTLPIQENMEQEIISIAKKWGSDAVRNSDGTQLPPDIQKLGHKVYATYFLTRKDQEWASTHQDHLQQLYLMSEPVTAIADAVKIKLMTGYFDQQLTVDLNHNPKEWWEVIDRTTGAVLDPSHWDFDPQKKTLTIKKAKKWHVYTVNFLAYMVWDPTQMYNHLTNQWGDGPHEMPYDPRHPETKEHMLDRLDQWLTAYPEVDVVRFTTFFYHFTLCFNEQAKEKYVDWFGYTSSISPLALAEFEKVKGYKLRSEDLVDEGYYNSPFRVPTKQYLDWLDFQQQFVCQLAKECVEIAHKHGKEAMMFLGDNWIGTEPYGEYFQDIGLDAVVGSVGNGVTLRLIGDIPGIKYTEGRFLPYFFPDVFNPNGDPIGEANKNWLEARRAILRKPIDRMGYGGYLSLAAQFPEFIDRVEEICQEFRDIHHNIRSARPYTAPFKVGILNCWGRLRAWQCQMVAHAIWYKQTYSYLGVLECLSGLPFEVEFLNFDDLKSKGIPQEIGVLINAGDAGTAWSGGDNWQDKEVLAKIREWVYMGGGLIGIGEPTASQYQGRYFQLAEVLGVDKEIGFSLSYTRYPKPLQREHFITQDVTNPIDFGEGMRSIYALSDQTKILAASEGEVNLAANTFGTGRAVYIAGLPYNFQNNRLLLRAIHWAASREREMKIWFTSNPKTEVAAYPDAERFAVINNSLHPVTTIISTGEGKKVEVLLKPMEIRWFDI
jgi:1,3-beta-galactosyl-N-acetylhexosamine phosphorylase